MAKQIKVVPAILTEDPRELETMVQEAETFADYAQVDFMDGRFVTSGFLDARGFLDAIKGGAWYILFIGVLAYIAVYSHPLEFGLCSCNSINASFSP